MAGGLPNVAFADTPGGSQLPKSISEQIAKNAKPLKAKVSPQLRRATGTVSAFIRTTATSGVEEKVQVRAQLDRQRDAASDAQKEKAANKQGVAKAKDAAKTAKKVFGALKAEDKKAEQLYVASYSIAGVAVTADAASLRALAKNKSVLSITPLTPKTAVSDPAATPTTTSTKQATASEKAKAKSAEAAAKKAAGTEVPTNKNSDQLVNAVKSWSQTGQTGNGVNVAVVDTGLDYTHADFGGAGTSQAYEEAYKTTGNPLTDPTVSKLLDKAKFKGGKDFAGPVYGTDTNGDGDADYDNAKPDDNPIDGVGGHHGTHVAGSVAGYGVTKDGKSFDGDYTKLTEGDVAGMEIGPGAAPDAGLYSLKVFGDLGGSTELVGQALDWVAQHNLTAKPADKIEIVSMSLGGSFGQSDDPENVQVDALAKDGVLSVIAAGNDGDVTDIMGAPGTAHSALTVAASQSGKTLQDAVEVADGPASLKGQKLAGQYSQNYTKLDDFSVTGKVVRVTGVAEDGETPNLDGCSPYSAEEAAAVKGNIAYVYWDDDDSTRACGSGQRFNTAEEAGAIGIVFGSSYNIPEAGIAGNAGIPGFQLVKNASDNKDLQKAIDDGALTLTLSSTLRLSLDADYSAESADTIASFTSRGIHGSYDGTVKPDVAAPGVGIISASAGTGSDAEIMSGTSMATPLTAGVVALVRSAHPDWDAYQVKQQLINTADHDVLTADRAKAYGPLRVGTGRIDALAAVENGVQVSSDDAVAVTGQFGIVQVPKDGYKATKTFTVANTTDQTRTYAVSYDPRTSTPGVNYTVSTGSITVQPHSSATFDVTLSIPNQSALRHTLDATQADNVGGMPTSYVTDASGIVKLTPADKAEDAFNLRVAVSSAPRPVSETDAIYTAAADGSRALNIAGHGFSQGAAEQSYDSQAVPLVLAAQSAADGYGVNDDPNTQAVRSLQSADIRAVGYSTTAPQLSDPSDGLVNFGIVTDKTWNHLGNDFVPDVLIDTNGDDAADYFATVFTTIGYTQYDTAWVEVFDLNTGELSDVEPIDDSFISDSNQVVFSLSLGALGFTEDSKSAQIGFGVQTESVYAEDAPDSYIADSVGLDQKTGDVNGTLSFDAYAPSLWFGAKNDADAEGGESFFPDQQDTTVAVNAKAGADTSKVQTLTLHTFGALPDKSDDPLTLDIDSLVDKTKLQAAVDAAGKLKESDYTKDSWGGFAKALAAAKQVLADPHATQAQVDAAAKALADAQAALAKPVVVDKTKLQAAVDAAGKLKESDYTKDSWGGFSKALAAAKQVLADGKATQEQVDAATKALAEAQKALAKPAEQSGDSSNGGEGSTPATPVEGEHGQLSTTGAAVSVVAVLAVISLALGSGMMLARRRANDDAQTHR
jgi:subtilisin family serine protease